MQLKLVFFFTAFLISSVILAQKESTYWYSFNRAGLKFTELPPVADLSANDSLINNGVNGASDATSISSSEGNLLFYGSGAGVFNKNHRAMPNGKFVGVQYNSSAEQAALIIPRPNNEAQYYFIYVKTAYQHYGGGIHGGAYNNLVDMSLDGGLGDVVDSVIHQLITDSTDEKITATPHANGIDYWLVLRKSNSNKYHAYLVTENGISTNPVISSIGIATSIQYQVTQGNMRFNHAGNMFANLGGSYVEIMDFDNQTGVLSNNRIINLVYAGAGLEFSPDDSKLYVGGPTQLDLSDPSQSAIQASEIFLAESSTALMAGLQMGLDGKIYGNTIGSSVAYYVSIIHNPNALGAACNHQDSAIYYLGRDGGVNVPQFLSSYFVTNFYADTVCVGEAAEFEINFVFIDSVLWNFGDPASGANNTDTALAPTHVFSDTGFYTVTLIAQNGVKTDTVIKNIYVKAPPEIDLGPDQDLCSTGNDTVVFSAGLPTHILREGIYQWSNGSVDPTLSLTNNDISTSPTEIHLQFTNECGTDADTALVYLSQPLTVNLPNTSTCEDSVIITANIDSNQSPISVFWTNGAGDTIGTQQLNTLGNAVSININRPTNAPSQSVKRTVAISNACGTYTDSANIIFHPQADGVLPNDSVYCSDIPFHVLNPQTDGVSYRWPDGTGGAQYLVKNTELVTLFSFSICDTLLDSFDVEFVPLPYTDLGADTAICLDEEVSLYPTPNPTAQELNFAWIDGSTDSILLISDTGLYSVTVTLKGCRITDSISIFQRGDCYDGCKPNLVNVITPNADGVNDQFGSFLDCPLENYRLQIFNRWGQAVFESAEPAFKWDGSINGAPASDGTYFYVLAYTPLAAGNEVIYRGSVSLVR